MTASKLESALKLARHGFRVFPLSPNSKIPLKESKNFSVIATTDPDTITNWWKKVPDANIGISTDNLLAVDIDTKDPKKNGIETMAKLNAEGKIFPPTTQQLTTTNGAHLIYSTPFPIKNSASKLGPGLDIRGRGGFLVGAGSTLGSKEYTIDLRPRVLAPDWLLEAVSAANEEKPQAHIKIEGVDPERAKERALRYMAELPPTTAGSRNAEGYKVAAKLKDIGLDKEDTFLVMMDEWKCEPPLELEELKAVVTSAYRYGKDAQGSAAPEAIFAPIEEEKSPEGEHPFQILNKEYAFVTMGSSHRIIRETTCEDGKFMLDHLNEDTFHKKLAFRKFQTADGNSKPLTKAWIASEKRRTYDAIVFSPGLSVPERFYNLWRGFSVEPLQENEQPTEGMIEAVRKFEEHMFVNVCDSNVEDYNWVYGWFAHVTQRPWEKPGVALVLKGRKGVGKNVLFDCVGKLFDSNYMVTAKRRHLTGTFNSHMENLLMLVLDEAFWSGHKEEEGILKALVTEHDLEIERKGMDSYKVKSRLRVGIVGNEEWLVPASHDERRYAVFNVGEGRKQDVKFFTEMREGMEAGGYRYLLTKLLKFDLSSINVRQAPDTVGLNEQKENTLSPLEKWFLNALHCGYFEGVSAMTDGTWQTSVDLKNFIDTFVASTKSRRNSVWLGSNFDIVKDIKKFLPSVKTVKKTGEPVQLEFPTLEECREEWIKTTRIKTKWETEEYE